MVRRRRSLGEVWHVYLTNLSAPMPLERKVVTLTRNMWARLVRRQSCCGHPGEPGC